MEEVCLLVKIKEARDNNSTLMALCFAIVLEYVGLGRLVVVSEFLPVVCLFGEASQGSFSWRIMKLLNYLIQHFFRRKSLMMLAGAERFRRVGNKLKMYTYFHELIRFLNLTTYLIITSFQKFTGDCIWFGFLCS